MLHCGSPHDVIDRFGAALRLSGCGWLIGAGFLKRRGEALSSDALWLAGLRIRLCGLYFDRTFDPWNHRGSANRQKSIRAQPNSRLDHHGPTGF
jgi:hypothetical protein